MRFVDISIGFGAAAIVSRMSLGYVMNGYC